MSLTGQNRLSIASRGVRRHFLIGVALLAVLPTLGIVYLATTGWSEGHELTPFWPVLTLAVVVLTALTGFLTLRRHPRFIVALRRRLEGILGGELRRHAPDEALVADDIVAIERCLTVLIETLTTRLGEVEREKSRLEDQIRQAQKINSMRTMAIGMAHDFNNLLAAILGNISIVIRNLPPEASSQENALQVEATALQAVELTNQIMAYSGKGQLHAKEFDLSALVRDLTNLLAVSVPRKVTVEYHLDDHLPPLTGDPMQLRQVVTNLVLNASDSYPSRQGTVTVTTALRSCDRGVLTHTYLEEDFVEGPYVSLQVADHGGGMTPEVQARMFDPFFTTKTRARGLGLSVVLGVTRAHGGAIRVESAPDQGTTLELLLPTAATRRPRTA